MAGKATSKPKRQKPKDIDSYLAAQPVAYRKLLAELRDTVRKVVPEATEAFVYGVPGFKLGGKSLVCYAGFKNHCGFYPLSPTVLEAFAAQLTAYETSEGTIRFTPRKPLPKTLLRKLVKARVSELRSAR